MSWLKFLLLALAAFLLVAPFARADAVVEDDAKFEEEPAEETTKPTGRRKVPQTVPEVADDIELIHLFPDNPFGNVVSGETTDVLIGFSNKGEKNYTVHVLSAKIWQPFDSSQVIQNLTGYRYDIKVDAGQQATFAYRFRTEYDPREIGFSVLLDFSDNDGTYYRAAGFNGTLSIVSQEESFLDLQLISLYFIFAGFAVGVFYLAKNVFFNSPSTPLKKKPSAPVLPVPVAEVPVNPEDVDLDWIPDHLKKGKNAGGKSSPKVKPKNA